MALHETDRTPTGTGRRRALFLGGAVLAALLVVAGVAIWWLTRDDAPEAASLETATSSISDDDDGEAGGDSADPADDGDAEVDGGDADDQPAPAAGNGDLSGDWAVDTSIGEFSFEDSTGTFVGFRVTEELSGLGQTEAVGRTPNVSGTVTIEGEQVTATAIEVDMAAITTNDSRRDNRVRGALDVDQFPTATFVLTEPIELGSSAATGDPVSTTAAGDLTVHGVTQPVTFDIDAQLVEDTIVIVGSVELSFSDFGVTVPSAPIVLSADDFGVVELQLFLNRS